MHLKSLESSCHPRAAFSALNFSRSLCTSAFLVSMGLRAWLSPCHVSTTLEEQHSAMTAPAELTQRFHLGRRTWAQQKYLEKPPEKRTSRTNLKRKQTKQNKKPNIWLY
jgi:hypothetical protein